MTSLSPIFDITLTTSQMHLSLVIY